LPSEFRKSKNNDESDERNDVHTRTFQYKKENYMRCKILIALTAWLLTSTLAAFAAEDGAALYKKKCAGCHGASGEGKSAMKAPALKGSALEVTQLVDHITKGEPSSKAPHNKGISGLTDEQAKAIAEYVKTLK
jgi:mono/diheme cytochrome c family protein